MRCSIGGRVHEANAVTGSDRFGEFVERSSDSKMPTVGVCPEFVVAAPQVLDECVTADHHRCRAVAFEPCGCPIFGRGLLTWGFVGRS